MTNDERDDVNDSQALTGGDITKYRTLLDTHPLLVARPTRSQVCDNASMLREVKPISV